MDLPEEFRHMDYAALEELYRDLEVFPILQDEDEIALVPPWMEVDATPPDSPDAVEAQESDEELPLLPPWMELDNK